MLGGHLGWQPGMFVWSACSRLPGACRCTPFPPLGEPGWALPLWVAQDSWGCLTPGEVSFLRLCRPYPNSSLQLVAFPPGSCWEVVLLLLSSG